MEAIRDGGTQSVAAIGKGGIRDGRKRIQGRGSLGDGG